MSHPTAMQRAQADAQLMKSMSTYAEVCMLLDSLAGVATREANRFGPGTSISEGLSKVGAELDLVRKLTEDRARHRS